MFQQSTKYTKSTQLKQSIQLNKIVQLNKFIYKMSNSINNTEFQIVGKPECSQINYKNLINNTKNHTIKVIESKDSNSKNGIICIGSLYHLLNGLYPKPSGLTLDIPKSQDPLRPLSDKRTGIIYKTTIQDTIHDIFCATSVTIRKNPILKIKDDKVRQYKLKEQLEEYKCSLVTWLRSLSTTPKKTYITFIRNVYSYNTKIQLKPTWCCGIGSSVIIDIGSSKAVCVSGTTGVQFGKYITYDSKQLNTKQIKEVCQQLYDEITKLKKGRDITISAFASGVWRELNMKDKYQIIEDYFKSKQINCKILSGEKEALYGGKSALFIAEPYLPDITNFLVIESGGGSTQYTRFKRNILLQKKEFEQGK